MVVFLRGFLRALLLLSMLLMVACPGGTGLDHISTTTTGTDGTGGGGPDLGPCGVDCTKFETPQCMMAVCNTGQYAGTLNTCTVVPVPDGTSCDDGQFCTVGDTCSKGACAGGPQNTCGLSTTPCVAVICYEQSKTCQSTPVNDGTACTPTDLCQVNGTCHIGDCIGQPKDCTFSPLNECNTVACDPATGKCTPKPDSTKDDTPCVLTGDVCSVNKTCMSGQCGAGTPKDCSAFTVGCAVGACDPTSGICGPQNAPVGTACTQGIPECHVGACDAKGGCIPTSAADGSACNDHNACTQTDLCTAGVCAGGPVAGCHVYLQEGFEVCPDGWTLGGDWKCGTPMTVGPLACHGGTSCVGTNIGAPYHNNQSYTTCVADSPSIDLSGATSPQLSFWAWSDTEGGTSDGWNLKVSTDGGATFTEVTTVSPPYLLTIATQPAWGGDQSTAGWQNYTADLSAFAGQSIKLRFAFRSDGAIVAPGVYVDDLVVAEPLQIPLYVSTSSLPDVYAGQSYSASVTRTGGTSGAVWSINQGSSANAAWLTIDPSTGVLSGTPTAADIGSVIVTVHVEEMALPSNFAEATFSFKVLHDVYYTSWEGTCPDGWTLAGDWQCGVPTAMGGPGAAYVGTQCIGTGMTTVYSNGDTWAGTTATSPDIDLTGVSSPTLTFRMWVDTEGSIYDGANLQVSVDGGSTYAVVTTVVPAYSLTIASEPAWGGHLGTLGWQLVHVDLSDYANQKIRLRFAFRSDSSGQYPGFFVDDFFLN
jgi:hypothetical protein